MCLVIGLLVVILGCAGAPTKKSAPELMTADAFLKTVLMETDGKCTLGQGLAYDCRLMMYPPDGEGNIKVQLVAREQGGDTKIVSSLHFAWEYEQHKVVRTK